MKETPLTPAHPSTTAVGAAQEIQAIVEALASVLRTQAKVEREQSEETLEVLRTIGRGFVDLDRDIDKLPTAGESRHALRKELATLVGRIGTTVDLHREGLAGRQASEAQLEQLQSQIAAMRGQRPEQTVDLVLGILARVAATSMSITVQTQLSLAGVQARAADSAQQALQIVLDALTTRIVADVLTPSTEEPPDGGS